MISYFPDLNVWLALSVSGHPHSARAWQWLDGVPDGTRLFFSRYTQIGLLRLLTNASVMGEQTITLKKAWSVYDRWLEDFRVDFHPEPRGTDAVFRETTTFFASQPASKVIGDCYLLAFAKHINSALVTFDAGLHGFAVRQGARSVVPE
jgi:toxin-antitoxin system PIN domain toxin